MLTKVAPRPSPLGKNQGTETSQKNLPWCMVARYGCVQKNCPNKMLTARVSSLTDRFILWLEATYEPEFWFSFFLNGGGAK